MSGVINLFFFRSDVVKNGLAFTEVVSCGMVSILGYFDSLLVARATCLDSLQSC